MHRSILARSSIPHPPTTPIPAPDVAAMPVSILLVDDDPRNLNVLEAILTSPDYRLVRAQNADEALRALVAETFALLVLDVRMPEMSGLELAQLIKQRKTTRHIPIIFLSAYYQEDEHVLQGYDAGAVDYLKKPCNPAVLRSKVAVFADLFRANRALEEEVTERRQAEEQLAERTAEVQQLVYQLRALATELTHAEQRERRRLAKVLHDHIQQLLVSAKMQVASLASEHLLGHTREVVNEVDAILREAISAARSVTVELSPPILQEAGLAAALRWLARRMTEKNRFHVDVHSEPDAEPGTEETRLLLFECARELLFNACKHAGVAQARVAVARTGDNWISMVVEDKGNGVDLAELRKQNVEQPTFGLFSIQQRLMHLGGSMDLESAPGQGMRITLVVPAGASMHPHLESHLAPVSTAAPASTPPTRLRDAIAVLIVDDHRIMRQGLVGLMRSEADIRVVGEAQNGDEAIELVDKLHPDVVIMDVNLGETSGLQLTKIILARRPTTRVIGLSMHEGDDIASAMKEAGAVAYLSKSVASTDLVATIRQVSQRPCRPPADGKALATRINALEEYAKPPGE
jgi:YesN/AraC family two-component response regulator